MVAVPRTYYISDPQALLTEYAYDEIRQIIYIPTRSEIVLRWDAVNRIFLDPLVFEGTINTIELSLDDATLFAGRHLGELVSDDRPLYTQIVEVVDLESGGRSQLIKRPHPDESSQDDDVHDIAFTANGTLIWTAEESVESNSIWFADLATGKIRNPKEHNALEINLGRGPQVIASETGEHVLIHAEGVSSKGLAIYDSATKQLVAWTDAFDWQGQIDPHHRGRISAISSAAELVVCPNWSGKAIRVFDFDFNIVARLKDASCNSFAFSEDGSRLFAFHQSTKTILQYDTETWDRVSIFDLRIPLGEFDIRWLHDLQFLKSDDLLVIAGHEGFAVTESGVRSNGIWGTQASERLTGGDRAEVLRGFGGDDVMAGSGGDDFVFGYDGADRLFGGDGEDVIRGGEGDDKLSGGTGDDTLEGGDGNDHMAGGAGNDRMKDVEGNNVFKGGAGHDSIQGGQGGDLLLGGGGGDRLVGGAGDDRLEGGTGDDRLAGNEGNDLLNGGGGDDRIDGGSGNDTLHDGGGSDRLSGGYGIDTFVLATDGKTDRIIDHGVGQDIIDIRSWGVDALEDIDISSIDWGPRSFPAYELSFGDERLIVCFGSIHINPSVDQVLDDLLI